MTRRDALLAAARAGDRAAQRALMRAPRRSSPSPSSPSSPSSPPIEPEESVQVRVASYLDARGHLWTHPPNGRYRSRGEAGKLRAEGVKSGVPDVLVFDPTACGCVGLALEIKRADGGKGTSPAQQWWLAELESRGWRTVCAHGYDGCIAAINAAYPNWTRTGATR